MSGVYIRFTGSGGIQLGGVRASQQMLDSGYVLYTGPIPDRARQDFLYWDETEEVIKEDLEGRKLKEIEEIERIRNRKLKDSDWMVTKYTELGVPIPEKYLTYRTTLRNITVGYEVGDEVVWPIHPDEPVEPVAEDPPPDEEVQPEIVTEETSNGS